MRLAQKGRSGGSPKTTLSHTRSTCTLKRPPHIPGNRDATQGPESRDPGWLIGSLHPLGHRGPEECQLHNWGLGGPVAEAAGSHVVTTRGSPFKVNK